MKGSYAALQNERVKKQEFIFSTPTLIQLVCCVLNFPIFTSISKNITYYNEIMLLEKGINLFLMENKIIIIIVCQGS